jgi:hypothetical protein
VKFFQKLACVIALAAPSWLALSHESQAADSDSSRFSFAAFGDTPYFAFEAVRLETLIPEMNAEALVFVLHVGDLKSSRDHRSGERPSLPVEGHK